MIVPYYPYPVSGGLEKQAHELAHSLVAQGRGVKVLAVRFSPSHPAHEVVDGVPVTRLGWPASKVLRFLTTALGLARVLFRDRHDYDVIHIHQHSWFGLSAVLLARLIGKPCLIKLPNVGDYGLPGMSGMHLGWLRIRLFKLADGVVSMSEESGRELDAIGFPPGRVFWTANGISLPQKRASGDYRQKNDPLRVVFVGRLMKQKGIVTLLRAWKKVVSNSTASCALEIWGDGPLASDLVKEREALGLSGSVVFKGHVSGVRDAMRSVDIFVLPSLNEGNSNSLLEAMAAGLAVVATRVGGTPLLVGAAGDDWLCEPGDVDTLAEKLIALLNSPDTRKCLGQAMEDRAHRYFDIQKIAASYSAAYDVLRDGRREQLSSCRLTWPGA
jgi:glycosyltransferase involved in cell wall biosynthesis